MLTNPVFILAIIALILAAISYIGQPTLGAAVILISVAVSLSAVHPH
jgi:hypothetical protein